jgi:hypothetical protein
VTTGAVILLTASGRSDVRVFARVRRDQHQLRYRVLHLVSAAMTVSVV